MQEYEPKIIKLPPPLQCEQALRMNRSGRKPDYKEGVLFKIKVDLGAGNLEVGVLPPEGTWRNDSQPEIDCLLIAKKEAEKYLGKTKTAKRRATNYSTGA